MSRSRHASGFPPRRLDAEILAALSRSHPPRNDPPALPTPIIWNTYMVTCTRQRLAPAAMLALLVVAFPSFGGEGDGDPAPATPKSSASLPINRLVGQRLANFTLSDVVTGKPVSLYGFRGKRAVALVF